MGFLKVFEKIELEEWVKAKLVEAGEHVVTCRRSDKGPPMRIAYEQKRKAPEGQIATELMSRNREEEIGAPVTLSEENSITLVGTDDVRGAMDTEDAIEMPPPMRQGVAPILHDDNMDAHKEDFVTQKNKRDSKRYDVLCHESSSKKEQEILR